MLPPIEDQRWNKLLYGEIKHEFRSMSAGLMFTRLRRQLENDSSTAAFLQCRQEAYAFFQKYEKILADDIAAIFH